MDDRTNHQLASAVLGGELSPRKEAVAKEVLRRRDESNEGSRRWRYIWLPLIGIVGFARMFLSRVRGRN
jgi:hypothetical protein